MGLWNFKYTGVFFFAKHLYFKSLFLEPKLRLIYIHKSIQISASCIIGLVFGGAAPPPHRYGRPALKSNSLGFYWLPPCWAREKILLMPEGGEGDATLPWMKCYIWVEAMMLHRDEVYRGFSFFIKRIVEVLHQETSYLCATWGYVTFMWRRC